MDAYLISIAAVVLTCGSVQYLAGDLKLKKQVFFVASLCIVFSLFAPIVTWLPNAIDSLVMQSTPTIPELPGSEFDMLLEKGEEAVSDAIRDHIVNKVGIKADDIFVKLSLSSEEIDNINIENINVYLNRETDGYLAKDISKLLRELFDCKITIYAGGDLCDV